MQFMGYADAKMGNHFFSWSRLSLVSSASPAYPRRPEELHASYFYLCRRVFGFLVLALLDGQAIF